MPRAKNPQDAVIHYFETAPLNEIPHVLRFAQHIVKARLAGAEANTPAPAAVAKPKPRKARGPKKPTPTATPLVPPATTTGVN